MSLQSRLSRQHTLDFLSTNDITNDLPSLRFEHGLNDFDTSYTNLRTRHHAMTVMSVAHGTYFVATINRARQIIADKKNPVNEQTMEFFNKQKARDPIKVGVIGGGRLGRQLVSSLLYFADVRKKEIMVSTRRPQLLESLQKSGVQCIYDNRLVAQQSDVLFLCFPPSELVSVANDINGHIPESSIVFSFLAATYVSRLQSVLKFNNVIRMILQWSPRNTATQWKVGNDVITSLLDHETVELCSPTNDLVGEDFAVIQPPRQTIVALLHHLINMLVDMALTPDEIMQVINQTLWPELLCRMPLFYTWNNFLTPQQMKTFEGDKNPEKRKLPRFDVSKFFQSGNSTFGHLVEKSHNFRPLLTQQFIASFSRVSK